MKFGQFVIIFLAVYGIIGLVDHLLGDVVARTQTTVEQAQEDQP